MLYSDANQIPPAKPDSQRFAVVGAGAVGLYAASQLAARGHDVILVEAGGQHLDSFPSDSYSSIGRDHTGIRLGRSRTLGGTTNLWGGQLVEFQPIDFNGREWLPQSAWPVSYDEIAPFYKPTYQNLGLPAQFLNDDDVWRGISCDRPNLGPDFEVFFTRWLEIPNFAEMFAQQIKTDPRMSVLTGHTVTGFRGSDDTIQAIRAVDSSGQPHWIEVDKVILAAGTIENVRLLLHAAQDTSWPAPWSTNENVGRYFQDHLGGKIASFQPADKPAFFRMFSNVVYSGRKFQPKIRMRNEVQIRQQLYNTQVFFAFESEVSEHMVYLKQFLRAALYSRKLTGIGDMFRNAFGMARYLVPLMWKYVWDHRIFVPSTAKILMHVQSEHAPLADSRITIDSTSIDSSGLPRVILDWKIDGNELVSLHEFAVQVRDSLQSTGIGELKIDEDLLARNPAFLSRLGDTYHQAGGTNMSGSEQTGVVDPNLRVFGTSNLYVTGAGVFPTTSNANTTFTALTFTTRLIDHLTSTA